MLNIVAILLYHTISNLHACPLPRDTNTSSAPCHQCDVLDYIENKHGQSSINLILNINLGNTRNNAVTFASHISSSSNNDYFFDPVSSSTNCVNDAAAGSPCTDRVQMVKSNQNLMCSWNYTCDYSPDRFPQYIWKAQCPRDIPGYQIHEVYYHMPVLTYTSTGSGSADCIPFKTPGATYTWSMLTVPVACTCVASS